MSYVYFIECKELRAVKIGTAGRPLARMAELQVGCPVELVMKKTMYAPGGVLERRLHEKFKHLRLRGEWFDARTGEIEDWLRGDIDRDKLSVGFVRLQPSRIGGRGWCVEVFDPRGEINVEYGCLLWSSEGVTVDVDEILKLAPGRVGYFYFRNDMTEALRLDAGLAPVILPVPELVKDKLVELFHARGPDSFDPGPVGLSRTDVLELSMAREAAPPPDGTP